MSRTSLTDPIYVGWCEHAAVPGRVGMTLAPGKWDPHPKFGPAWARDLGLDLQRLREVEHVDQLVSLVEEPELRLLRIEHLTRESAARGLPLVRFPIPDGGVPADLVAARALVAQSAARLRAGERLVYHCRGGLGRAGTMAACTLMELGLTPDAALAEVRRARKGAIETSVQEAFIRAWVASAGGRG
jgi:protein-tyrosine phosphatase